MRVLWMIVGVGLTTLGVISLTTIPAWPILGVAVATVALVINQMTSRLRQPICLGCGHDLTGQPLGEHGTICPACGAVHQELALLPHQGAAGAPKTPEPGVEPSQKQA
jgi:hypothetical protein